MRQIPPYSLWLGHIGHVRDLQSVLAAGIVALVDLAMDEPPAVLMRELVYCRFPLVDGIGNPPWLLRTAISTTAHLLQANVPTLVYCGAGMSRSAAIAAAAVAWVSSKEPEECLSQVVRGGVGDVSPGLWQEIMAAYRER